MQTWRAIGKIVVVAGFFAACFVLLARVIGPRSPWLGLLLMFYFLGLAKVASPLWSFRMPASLRAVRQGPVAARTTRLLGVRAFGRLLRNSPFRHLNDAVYLARGRHSFADVRLRAEAAEAAHLWAALLFTPYIVYVGSIGRPVVAALFVVVQVVVNVYPILHLRLVRARLARVAGDVSSSAPTHP